MLTAILKTPKVKTLKGRVIVFNIGFIKKFKSPKTTPKIKKTCHCSVSLNPKKVEFGNVSIITPATSELLIHNPKIPATI